MADMNDLFEVFPDYDVFADSIEPSERPRSRRPMHEQPRRPIPEQHGARRPLLQNQSRPNDYGDGFGEYVERKTKLSNFTTLFFFPFIIIWLEVVLRLAAGESFLSVGVVYTLLFTIPISCVLTLLCTFAGEYLNRSLAYIFAAALTLMYLWQLIYYNAAGALFTFSGNARPLRFEQICSIAVGKWFFLALSVVPLLVSLLVGRRMFRFKRIRVRAKFMLVILAVVFHFVSFGLVYTSQFLNSDSYALYQNMAQSAVQERFGLITMQILDISEMIR